MIVFIAATSPSRLLQFSTLKIQIAVIVPIAGFVVRINFCLLPATEHGRGYDLLCFHL